LAVTSLGDRQGIMDNASSAIATANSAKIGDAIYFDGSSNRKRNVTLHLVDALEIIEDGALIETWPFDAIRRADGPADRLRLMCSKALPLARLEVADAAMQKALLTRGRSLDVHEAKQTWRIVGWSLAAACSIIALIWFGIPLAADRLAPLVPKKMENWIGEAVDKQVRVIFRGKDCASLEGQAAFTALVEKLKKAGGLDDSLEAHVISTKIPNAFALPGGKIYLFDGLLQKANNADEIAGVIAHELGHVRNRDSMRHLIQTGGTSFLIGLLFGDVTGGGAVIFTTQALLNSSFSRDVERQADAFAVSAMHGLGRSPKPLGELLLRVTGSEEKDALAKEALSILSSHPLTEERLAMMKKADAPNTGADILSAKEWRALKTICGRPKDAADRLPLE
jgi:Zn-dependent protease with chaperone function